MQQPWICRYIGVVCAVGLCVIIGCDKERQKQQVRREQQKQQEQQEEKRETTKPGEMTMEIKTSAFANGEKIPTRFTGDGEDVSPALTWSGVPDGAKELVLICDDPDAPTSEPWVHWVIYKIPVSATGLAEHVLATEVLTEPSGAFQGKNSWGTIGYRGPAPPKGHGVHHYDFKLYALDTALSVPGSLDKKQLLKAMQGHILAEAEVVGTYQR